MFKNHYAKIVDKIYRAMMLLVYLSEIGKNCSFQ
ncbi:MAG: hypothetical protein ACI934_001622 [Pseudohongiellaceae bacterium]